VSFQLTDVRSVVQTSTPPIQIPVLFPSSRHGSSSSLAISPVPSEDSLHRRKGSSSSDLGSQHLNKSLGATGHRKGNSRRSRSTSVSFGHSDEDDDDADSMDTWSSPPTLPLTPFTNQVCRYVCMVGSFKLDLNFLAS
jgi:hypothetical protein